MIDPELPDGGGGVDAVALTVRLPGIHRVRPRDTLPLSALAGHLHLFDTERGARIA